MNLIGYLRVSTKKQKKSGLGIAAQRRAIYEYAQRTGNTIIAEERDEAKSGKSLDGREGLDRAIAACKAGLADGIVIAKLDRLIRNTADYHKMRDEAAKDGYYLIALEYSGMDPEDPATELMQGIGAQYAQYERRLISIRTKNALRELKAQGKILGRPHSQPVSIRKLARRMRAEGYTVDETFAVIQQRASNPPSRATVARMMNDTTIPLPNIAAEAIHAAGGHP